MAFVNPTVRPKSVCNPCVTKVLGGVCVLSRCFMDFPMGVGDIVIRISQISFFFSSPLISKRLQVHCYSYVIMYISGRESVYTAPSTGRLCPCFRRTAYVCSISGRESVYTAPSTGGLCPCFRRTAYVCCFIYFRRGICVHCPFYWWTMSLL